MPRNHLTPHQIAALAEAKSETLLGQIREVNRLYRRQDESHLRPICGQFDATERAIRKARKLYAETGTIAGIEQEPRT